VLFLFHTIRLIFSIHVFISTYYQQKNFNNIIACSRIFDIDKFATRVLDNNYIYFGFTHYLWFLTPTFKSLRQLMPNFYHLILTKESHQFLIEDTINFMAN